MEVVVPHPEVAFPYPIARDSILSPHVPSTTSPPAGGQRLRRADLRNRVVPITAVGHRIIGGLTGTLVSGLHEWAVSWQCGVAALRAAARTSAEGLCRARVGHWRVRPGRVVR